MLTLKRTETGVAMTFTVEGYRHDIAVRIEHDGIVYLKEAGGKEYSLPLSFVYLQAVKKAAS
jgi:hypothetical protein